MRLTKSNVVSGVLAVALLGATATAWYYADQAQTPAQRAAETEEPDDSTISVRVEEGQLLDTVTLSGELERAGDVAVNGPTAVEGAETVIVSKIPLEVGDDVNAGTVLMEVSGRPLIALPGAIPAYRDLVEGESEGPDVKQLQAALSWIYGTPQTGEFDSRTAKDLKKLYEARDYEPRYQTEEVIDDPPETDPDAEPGDENAAPQEPTTSEVKKIVAPASELVFLEDLPMQVGKINAKLSAPLGEGSVMSLVSGDWSLAVELTNDEAAEFNNLGEDIELEFGSGPLSEGAPGVPELEEREVEAENNEGFYGEEGESTTEKYFAIFSFDTDDVPAEDLVPGAEQEITVVRARSAEDALIVPLSALWTDSEGKTMLTVLEGEDEATERRVEVNVTLRHDGKGVVEPVEGELRVREKVVVAWRDRGNG